MGNGPSHIQNLVSEELGYHRISRCFRPCQRLYPDEKDELKQFIAENYEQEKRPIQPPDVNESELTATTSFADFSEVCLRDPDCFLRYLLKKKGHLFWVTESVSVVCFFAHGY